MGSSRIPELTQGDLTIPRLGTSKIQSPLNLSNTRGDGRGDFVPANSRIRYQIHTLPGTAHQDLELEQAGPRERIFFHPENTTAAIVTCGGLCPGLNNVVRSIFHELKHNYRVPRILGIHNGYAGLNPEQGRPPSQLTDDDVVEIHKLGGVILGTSRGPQDAAVIVKFLQREKIDILFCVGGDGTLRGAHAVSQEIARRDLKISVAGIPKTIDNDIPFVYRTFGFSTALEEAQQALRCAHAEANSAVNGVGLVKLMGRHAGFITAYAALASQDANFVLVPEIDFPLEGPDGLLVSLQQRLERRNHAVIAVAEGAGQHLFDSDLDHFDASGNPKFRDIGPFLKLRIERHFQQQKIPISVKYIDPSYLIRSVPANAQDRLLSNQMARFAVHAAMAGNTDVLIGHWNNCFVHVPIGTAVRTSKCMEVEGDLWTSVLLSTGQPRWPATPKS
ncbi:MAG: diphosphate--fructose-6-phosphate 1-phosphotransferase [Planctomycetaceae bacterium]|jgi:6-phosphofructokinase 1|nr:diphosphate--fructose-6-phosphate 1-phosphotransferase [Planctomycetaceae bacterium]MBP61298.1 diphosphate--fructose-6-phosphate 1-phosphotransferase [Planctomycetaceae bacterium]